MYELLESRRPRRPKYKEWDRVNEEHLRFFNPFAYFMEDIPAQKFIRPTGTERYRAVCHSNMKHLGNFRKNVKDKQFIELFQLVNVNKLRSFLESDWRVLINGEDFYVLCVNSDKADVHLDKKRVLNLQFYRLKNAMNRLKHEIRHGDLLR